MKTWIIKEKAMKNQALLVIDVQRGRRQINRALESGAESGYRHAQENR